VLSRADQKVDDLVAAIVAELGRVRHPRQMRGDPSHETLVRITIRSVQGLVKNYYDRDAIRQARDAAREIVSTVDKLERQLDSAPPMLRVAIPASEHLVLLGAPAANEYVSDRLRRELGYLRRVCADAEARLPAADLVKDWCAKEAGLLVLSISRTIPTNTDNSPFREIAGLLYVAVDRARIAAWRAGGHPPDLRRACIAAGRELRSLHKSPPKKSFD
jgi:hypothetical protein